MSRYGEGDEADYNNSWALWDAAYRNALRGKRGQQVLRELREALLALPEHRLISRALCTVGGEARVLQEVPDTNYERWESTKPEEAARWRDNDRREVRDLIEEVGEGVCAVGAYLWHRKVKAGMDPMEAFVTLPMLDDQNHSIEETAHEAKLVGVAGVLAWNLAYRNDEEYGRLTPEARWQAFMDWIDSALTTHNNEAVRSGG